MKVKTILDPTIKLSNSLVSNLTSINSVIGYFTTDQAETWNFTLTNNLDKENGKNET